MTSAFRIVFAGTPDFSVEALNTLLANDYEVCAVYTQPDRPAGRGRKLTPSPVKQRAVEKNIPVFQPASLKHPQAQQELAALAPDIMVVVAYGLLLPPEVLNIPRLGCLNIHASLLPRWRGAAPIQRAILAGDKESGVAIMQMNQGLDTGDVLAEVRTAINDDDTGGSLHDRLAVMGGELLIQVLKQLQQGTATATPQDDSLSTYAPKLDKAEAKLDWSQSAIDLKHKVNAFNPWPVAFTHWGDKSLRIWQAVVEPDDCTQVPGSVLGADRDGIRVATGDGVLVLKRVQIPGKKPMDVADFINAHQLDGVVFGDA